jgi:hypothetical protein
LSNDDHRRLETEWRRFYGHVFEARPRCGHGTKAVHEYLSESATRWLFVPFCSNVPGIPMHLLTSRMSAFECDGRLLELAEFSAIEFFVSPPDFAWTFVRTHEDFAFGGPYFLRAEWMIDPDESLGR